MREMNKMRFVAWIMAPVCAVAFGLSACLPEAEEPAPADAEQPDAQTPAPQAAALVLEPFDNTAFRGAEIAGELGCAFTLERSAGALPIMRAAGFVGDSASGEALVVTGGQPVRLSVDGEGGYDAIADGTRFSGEGWQVAVERTATEPLTEDPQIAMESPVYPAMLTVMHDSDSRDIPGFWECGP